MPDHKLDAAIQKIIAHIAETGKPIEEAIEYLWEELAFEQSEIERFARRYLDGSYESDPYRDEEDFACVSQTLYQELDKFSEPEGSSPGERTGRGCEVLTPTEVEKVLSTMAPLFGKPRCRYLDEAPGRQYAWQAETAEKALQMLTTLDNLGVKCYRGCRSGTSVRIYGPWGDRKKINAVLKKLDHC